MKDFITVRGVRVNNLKSVDADIPVNKLTVMTGPSGSGKSSLAFDTLYAEGRRRFVQSLSAYARQFLERIERPDADSIESIFPAIAIQQKNHISGSRSTVGTISEIYDLLRLLFARLGIVRDPATGEVVRNHSVRDVVQAMEKAEQGARVVIAFQTDVKAKRNVLLQKGFIRAIDNPDELTFARVEEMPVVIPAGTMIVADRIKAGSVESSRMVEAVETSFLEGGGICHLNINGRWTQFDTEFRSSRGETFLKPEPDLFSFNNPYGACPRCKGFGDVIDIDPNAVVPDESRSIADGAIDPLRRSSRTRQFQKLLEFCEQENIPVDLPWKDLSKEQQHLVFEGKGRYKAVRGFFNRLEKKKYKMHIRVFLSRYRGYYTCPDCKGRRLRKEALTVRIGKKNIGHAAAMSISDLLDWLRDIKMNDFQREVVQRVHTDLLRRLELLESMGVGYLNLNRRAQTLSGGEFQRINLGTVLGGGLMGSLFVLDEPTIGLHERDTSRLIDILKSIRDKGNTVVVVEHDAEVMKSADNIVDLGPGAGSRGGEILYSGDFPGFLRAESSTARFLTGDRSIPVKNVRRKGSDFPLVIKGARENNLKNITAELPLNCICCVTGVSGSGKSTLVHDVLYANLMNQRGGWQKKVGECDSVDVPGPMPHVEMVDQKPIGKSPRSNPATYIKAYGDIRQLFAERYQARVRGYKPAHFSFNVKGGRCETCQGNGTISIEMQFMPDITIPCDDCGGKRFKREVLDIRYKSLNIHDVLQLSVDEAMLLFKDYPGITRKLSVLEEVGLGYLKLGQSALTLSGGEAQRIKLAAHMNKGDVKDNLFIFDEPTTGLHFGDIQKLLKALQRLVFHGASVVVIEHNMEIIKNADWIIDLGPEGGDKGGWIVASGTPEEVAARPGSHTGKYLKKYLGNFHD